MIVLKVLEETKILGKSITMYGNIENPLFMASDVSDWIEHSNPRMMLKSIDKDEKDVRNVYTLGGIQEKWFITEDGLYEVCMQSRKPIAKQMKKEIKLFLKQIRLTGGYIPILETDTDNMIMAKAIKIAEKTIQEKEIIIQEYQNKIKQLEPDAELVNDLIKRKGYLTLKQVADLIEIGRTTLCSLLRDKKILSKQTGFNEPMGKYIKSSYFKTVVEEDERTKHVSIVTLVSPKGLKFIYRLIKRNELLNEFDTTSLLEVQANV